MNIRHQLARLARRSFAPRGAGPAPPRPAPGVLMLLENNPFPQDPRVRREACSLVGAGYRVALICPAARGQPRREVVDGVRVYRFRAPRGGDGLAGYAWEFGYATAAIFALSLRVWWREGFAVVHAHNPPDTLALIGGLYKLMGKALIFDHHDLSPELYAARFDGRARPAVTLALELLERLACRLADRVLATNESYRAIEIARCGVPPARIAIVRNGPGEDLLLPAAPDAALRPPGKTVIAYVGQMGAHDGVDHLLRALRFLIFDLGRADVCCWLVGGGSAWEEMRALAARLSLGGHVHFTGWVPHGDVARYLASADICVAPEPSNPYNDRSTAIKLMEYMAQGKPIVAFDLPEHRFSARGAARYAAPNDDAALARAIAELIDDPAARAAQGALGRERAAGALAWRYSEPHLLRAYAALLQGRPDMRHAHR